jgi:LmbE family N-acetylglucosaminyl deacetylase
MNFERVLIVVAHPDDEVLGCGGTIAKLLSEGKTVRIVIVAEGSSCRFDRDQIACDASLAAIRQRRGFADQAMAVLRVKDVVFHDLPCGRLDQVPIIDIGKIVEAHIREFRPDTVFTHSGTDANSDHRTVFNAVITATRPLPGSCVRHVLTMEILSSSEWRFVDTFHPTYFVDIGEHLAKKIQAFDCYYPTEGQAFPHPRCEEGLRVHACMRGMQVGVRHAEAFQLVRSIQS